MKEDYSFLFEPPKDSDVFTRTLYYPPSSKSPDPPLPLNTTNNFPTNLESDRHSTTLSKFATGVFSSTSAGKDTVTPFLNEHIPDQVNISARRGTSTTLNEVYCYRHQPDLRCQRRIPQEHTMAEIQKVIPTIQHSQ